MRLLLSLCCGAWLLLVSSLTHAETRLILRIPDPGLVEAAATGHFYIDALKLALSKTAPDGEIIEFIYFGNNVGRERLRLMVDQGSLDLLWSSSTKEREERLHAIKINLLKGINEYRFLLIRAEDQEKFSGIETLEELRQFNVGGGTHWSDMQIFQANGFHTVTSWQFDSLFKMLAAKRFDFIPRTLDEILTEIDSHPGMNFAMENHLILHYSQPIYFFVSRKNNSLAQRIQQGLEIAQQDGSLDSLFFSIPNYKTTWEYLERMNKKVLWLETPKDQALEKPNPEKLHQL